TRRRGRTPAGRSRSALSAAAPRAPRPPAASLPARPSSFLLPDNEMPPPARLRITGWSGRSSHHALLSQRRNRPLVVAEPTQDLVGVLAQRRRAAADGARCLRQPHRHLGDGGGLRRAGELGRLEEAHGL